MPTTLKEDLADLAARIRLLDQDSAGVTELHGALLDVVDRHGDALGLTSADVLEIGSAVHGGAAIGLVAQSVQAN